jgi:hypothetical protein
MPTLNPKPKNEKKKTTKKKTKINLGFQSKLASSKGVYLNALLLFSSTTKCLLKLYLPK